MFSKTILYILQNSDRITIDDLAVRIGCKRRDIEHAIEDLRNQGYPICSECSKKDKGIYLAKTESEAEPWMRQMYSRINKMFDKCSLMKKYWESKKSESIQLKLELFN